MGKRKALMITTAISVVGYVIKWFSYNPDLPWLVLVPAPLMAFGFGGLFTLVPAMLADVVDLDELKTHERREGMFGSIYWWIVKLGLAVALAVSGVLLNVTGFDVELGINQTDRALFLMRVFDVLIPAVTSAIAIWAVARFPITEDTAYDVRMQLEQRRGATPAEGALDA